MTKSSLEWRRKISLRPWQNEAYSAWASSARKGIAKVVTGGGKTLFAEACILDFLNTNLESQVVICVPTTALLDQWWASIVEDLTIPTSEIALISSSERFQGFKRINIGVVNSLRNKDLSQLKKNSFLIVDECHRVATPINAEIFQRKFAATLGLSATPERAYDDGLEAILIPHLGKVFFEYDMVRAIRENVVCNFSAINIELPFLEDEAREYKQLTTRATRTLKKLESTGQGQEALKMILLKRARVCANARYREPFAIKLVHQHPDARIIIFHESQKAAERIFKGLRSTGISATIYHSAIGPEIRRDNLRLFRNGTYAVLVCCKALDEGINVPEASVGIIASGTASSRQRVQRMGRILRPSPNKSSAVVYTLFTTKGEKARLTAEEARLAEIVEVTWLRGSVGV